MDILLKRGELIRNKKSIPFVKHHQTIILSIDPGITNLGLAVAFVGNKRTETYSISSNKRKRKRKEEENPSLPILTPSDFVFCETLDLKNFGTEENCQIENCPYSHGKELWRRVEHLIHEYGIFKYADEILMERQVPNGGPGDGVGNLICSYISSCYSQSKRIHYIPTNSFISYFGWGEYDRDNRKELVVKEACKWISSSLCPNLYQKEIQVHDRADAAVFIVYWILEGKEKEETNKKIKQKQEEPEYSSEQEEEELVELI